MMAYGYRKLRNPSQPTADTEFRVPMMQGMKRRNDNKDQQLGNMWDVVASLAHALTDARNQLVGLIHYQRKKNSNAFRQVHGKESGISRSSEVRECIPRTTNSILRFRGGGNCGPYYQSFTSSNRRAIEQHCQNEPNHVTFENESKFKALMPSQGKPGANKEIQAGLNANPTLNCLRINNSSNKGGNPVSINLHPKPCPSPPQLVCFKDVNCRPPSPDRKRHCKGTQYAALLREEAFRIRERRLAEEYVPSSKPKWTRC
uniref:Uncharacterized protein n=2 Tax=Physcomitrium patens TaxID=3218 RepID=A0A7I3ZCC3_PHYPA